MDRWIGRVALVTGSSGGIGSAIVKDLVRHGMKVVGVDKDILKTQEMANELSGSKGNLVALKCDLTIDQDIYDVFKTIKDTFGGVDVCVNNAGICVATSLLDGTPDGWRAMMNVNVVASCLCTKLSIASMRERGVDDGHIINMSSGAGRIVPRIEIVHFYSATKFAVNAITEGLRQELRAAKSHIRTTSICPGIVNTELLRSSISDANNLQILNPEDVSATLLHILAAPPHVEINDVFIIPTEV